MERGPNRIFFIVVMFYTNDLCDIVILKILFKEFAQFDRDAVVTKLERGCINFPVPQHATERCYDLRNSADIEEISPDRIPYSGSTRILEDKVTICKGDDCNDEPINVIRYCVNPEREEGIGKLAAQISSKAPQKNNLSPLLFVIYMTLYLV